jgi:hypothetical protein
MGLTWRRDQVTGAVDSQDRRKTEVVASTGLPDLRPELPLCALPCHRATRRRFPEFRAKRQCREQPLATAMTQRRLLPVCVCHALAVEVSTHSGLNDRHIRCLGHSAFASPSRGSRSRARPSGRSHSPKKTPCREAGRPTLLRSIALRGRSPIGVLIRVAAARCRCRR